MEKTKIQKKSLMQFKNIISSTKSIKIFDLGMHPYADTFVKKKIYIKMSLYFHCNAI